MDLDILGGLLKRVGNFSMKSFEKRLLFQKTVYFLQAFGINLGYKYNWYIAGPYSPPLASDGFKLQVVYGKSPDVDFVQGEYKKIFENFLFFIKKRKNDKKELELLASVHFLSNVDYSKQKIVKMMQNKAEVFENKEINEAFDILKEEGLL